MIKKFTEHIDWWSEYWLDYNFNYAPAQSFNINILYDELPTNWRAEYLIPVRIFGLVLLKCYYLVSPIKTLNTTIGSLSWK